jgi:hypothetical protein
VQAQRRQSEGDTREPGHQAGNRIAFSTSHLLPNLIAGNLPWRIRRRTDSG